MRIGGFLVVRNEERLIEMNVRYHLEVQGFDLLIVVDDSSTDRTRQILASIDDPRLIVRRNPPGLGHGQSLGSTLAARELLINGLCDWALPIDADEFWVSRLGGTVREALAAVPEQVRMLATEGYRFIETALDDPEQADFRLRQRYAALEERSTRRVVLHRELGPRLRGMVLGNHVARFTPGEAVHAEPLPAPVLARYHYRHAGLELYREKIRVQGEGFLRQYGSDWLDTPGEKSRRIAHWYRLLRSGGFDEAYRAAFVQGEQETRARLAEGSLLQLDELAARVPETGSWSPDAASGVADRPLWLDEPRAYVPGEDLFALLEENPLPDAEEKSDEEAA